MDDKNKTRKSSIYNRLFDHLDNEEDAEEEAAGKRAEAERAKEEEKGQILAEASIDERESGAISSELMNSALRPQRKPSASSYSTAMNEGEVDSHMILCHWNVIMHTMHTCSHLQLYI